jgi:hypothetical protein
MVGKAAEACPTLLSPGSAPLSELRELAETKAAARLPPDFAKNLVAATLGVELTNKVRFCITKKNTCFAARIIFSSVGSLNYVNTYTLRRNTCCDLKICLLQMKY